MRILTNKKTGKKIQIIETLEEHMEFNRLMSKQEFLEDVQKDFIEEFHKESNGEIGKALCVPYDEKTGIITPVNPSMHTWETIEKDFV